MKINRVYIKNFRSIKETDFSLAPGVTALAGGNESGKSNVLLAINKFLNLETFMDTDQYQLSDNPPEIEMTFNNFAQEENEKLKTLFGKKSLDKLIVRRVGEVYTVVDPQLPTENQDPSLSPVPGIKEATPESTDPSQMQEPTKKIPSNDEIIQEIRQLIPSAELIRSVEYLIEGNNIPISDIYATDEEIEKKDIQTQERISTLKAILDLGGITESDVREPDLAKRSLTLQRGAAKVAKRLRESWRQEYIMMGIVADQAHLHIWFMDGKNRPRGKDSMDDTKWIRTLPENRSTGFRWYITFYVRYLAALDKSENLCVLIDDAGAPLNKIAQEDLLDEFSKYANENSGTQILYTTHSKYMVKWDFRDHIRLATKENGEGTKVVEMWWRQYSPRELPAPLDELGVTWSDDFLQYDNLIVEGYSDVYLLHHLPINLVDMGLDDSYSGFKILNAGKASVEKDVGLLCKINERRAFLLFDSDGPGKQYEQEAELIKEEHLLDCDHIKNLIGAGLTYNVFTIEDLIPRKNFIDALNNVCRKNFGEKWAEIVILQQIDELGIVEATINRMIQNGFNQEETEKFKLVLKFDVIKEAVDSVILTSYDNEEQLKAMQILFIKLNERLKNLTPQAI